MDQAVLNRLKESQDRDPGIEILHMEGPPRAYFEVSGDGKSVIRIRYRLLGFRSKNSGTAQSALLKVLSEIDRRLIEMGSQVYPIIWWRRRIAENYHADLGMFSWSCRLETTPFLPEEFWQQYEAPEGLLYSEV